MQHTSPKRAGLGSAWFTFAGIAAAFGVASCCALPFLFASAGISAAWLGGIGILAAPHRTPLLVLSLASLGAGALMLLRQQIRAARCGPDGVCAPAWLRLLSLAGLIVGAALLWLGYRYV